MAAPAPPSTQPSTLSSAPRSRAPHPLNATQEAEVREIYYKNVRSYCADAIKAFVDCASGRTVSVAWTCRSLNRAMNECMKAHATREEQDKARTQWFATRDERRKEREARNAKQEEKKKFHHDYWGLDEQGRRIFDKDRIKKVEDLPLIDPGKK